MFDLTGPIVPSRLEPDFYKFTMGQLIWRKYCQVPVTFAFRNRTRQAALGRVLDLGEVREQLEHARSLTFTNSELHYLRGTNEYQERMFDEGYLEYLRTSRLPEYALGRDGDALVLEFTGAWGEVTYWETIALSIVNEVYSRTLLRRLSRFEQQAIFATGVRRLRDTIATLRAYPDVVFSDFGTRRRFAGEWQRYLDQVLRDELNGGGVQGRFLGTSNTHSAMLAGLVPMGTSAHELPMILAGLLDVGDDDPQWLERAQRQVIDDWWEQYGWGLSIFLPDTFGSDLFFRVVGEDDLRRWKGFRWDSGDLFGFAERVIEAYRAIGVDSRTKMLVASDALDLPLMIEAQERLGARLRVSHGWGTGLTNNLLDRVMVGDHWFGPMSLVVKPTHANGRGLVKLSDNPAKASGTPEDIARYTRAARYADRPSVELTY